MTQLDKARQLAILAVEHYADVCSVNETMFTGWGEQTVPPEAEKIRIEAGKCLLILRSHEPGSASNPITNYGVGKADYGN